MANAKANEKRATITKTNIKEFDLAKRAKLESESNVTLESIAKAECAIIEINEDNKEIAAKDGFICWFNQGNAIINIRTAWIKDGGDITAKKAGSSFKSYIESRGDFRLSTNDRTDAVWVSEHWAQVSKHDLSENDMNGLSVSAIKKRIKEALQTPAETAAKEKKANERKDAKEAAETQAKSDQDELKAYRDGTHENAKKRVITCPIEYANIVCAEVTLAFKIEDVLKFIDQCSKNLGLFQNATVAEIYANAKDVTPNETETPVFELTIEQVQKPKAKKTRKPNNWKTNPNPKKGGPKNPRCHAMGAVTSLDELAECFDGVSMELTTRLWEVLNLHGKPLPSAEGIDPETFNCRNQGNMVKTLWKHFTIEEKLAINAAFVRKFP